MLGKFHLDVGILKETVVGIFAGVMSMIGGYPMGIHNVSEVHRFSMFLPAPILSTILLVVLCLPGTSKMITGD